MRPKHLLLFFCFILITLKINAQRPFITTWDSRAVGVSDDTHIVFYATGDNFQVSWVNMSNASDTGNMAGVNGANTISFAEPGIYKLYLSPGDGSFTAFTLSEDFTVNHDDGYKMLSIEQWGDIHWSTFNAAFANCQSMVMNALDTPDLSNVTDMFAAFFLCRSLTTNDAMSDWDVSHVTNMGSLFSAAFNFNQPIGNWNVSNVTSMNGMFATATVFDQPIGNWDVGKVTDMYGMLYWATSFNQPLGNWNVSNVTNMSMMFSEAFSFDQPITKWNVSSVTTMSEMFLDAVSFNQPIGNWDVSNVTIMSGMFWGASSFNQPVGNWDVSNVTDMGGMFWDVNTFNQPIGDWDVSNVTIMSGMFWGASTFNQPIGNWNVSNVKDMGSMFQDADSFKQPIGKWNTGNVTRMDFMFSGTGNFNQDIANWDVSNVKDMSGMFQYADSFNQPIGNWNVSNVTDMRSMFFNAGSFNQPIENWDVRKVQGMDAMFYSAKNFNQSLAGWNFKDISSNGFFGISNMLDSCGMDCSNYSKTLRGWAANAELQTYLAFGAANLTYDSAFAKAAHDSLINLKEWAIIRDAMGHCSVVLPVNFLSFSVTEQDNTALLGWSVADEINNKGYYVEKSSNGVTFNSIAFVAGKSASKQTTYTYTDNNLTNGKTYYRIKEVDNDGKYMYSGIREIVQASFAWNIHGNPVNNSFIELSLDKPANISVTIVSSTGNNIKTIKKGNLVAGNYSIPLNMDNVNAGLYFIKLMVANRVYTSAIVKQ